MNVSDEIKKAIETLNCVLDFLIEQNDLRQKIKVISSRIGADEAQSTDAEAPKKANCQFNIQKIADLSQKEIDEMPKIKNVSFYKRNDGYLQAVYYLNGKRKSFSAKKRDVLIKRVKDFLKYNQPKELATCTDIRKFCPLVEFWFENVKKISVSEAYFKTMQSAYRLHIKEYFKNYYVQSVTAIVLQPYFNKLFSESGKITEVVKSIMNGIFEYAVGNGLIKLNPMRAVYVEKHCREKGKALTREELATLKEKIQTRVTYRLPILLFLYTGARRSEYASMIFDFEKNIVTITNSKLKRYQKRNIENLTRTIPILPDLLPYRAAIEDGKWRTVSLNELAKEFAKIIVGASLRFTRHTFQTYSLACGVPEEIVNCWAGHTPGRTTTGRIYLHPMQDDFQKYAKNVHF